MHKSLPKFIHVLLNAEDEQSDEYKAAVAQLERQPHWQPALEKLALGDSKWWPEAQSVLADSGLPSSNHLDKTVTVEIESSLADDVPIDCERVPLDFLDPPSHPELLGRIDRYEVERVLGTGGMGVVLRAFDTDLHRVVAIKVLASHLAHNSSARRRFAREAQAAAAVVHPNVIPIFNVESDAKTPFIVMHYVAGQSLQRRVDVEGPLPIVEALRIAQQTAAGLTAAHAQGLVHRDVKPANILLEEQIERVMLSDFGLARAVDDASLTKTGIVAGTPHYMSPEQALGENVDHRSDLFSLGSVLYFMLAGHPPFRASGAMAVLHRICQFPHRSLIEVNRDVPIEVSRLVDRLLAKKPGERLGSASQAEVELAALLNNLQQRGVSIQSADASAPSPTQKQAKSWQTPVAKNFTRKVIFVLACVGLVALGRTIPSWLSVQPTPMSQSPASTQPTTIAPPTSLSEDSKSDIAAVEQEALRWQSADEQYRVLVEDVAQSTRILELELSPLLPSQDNFYTESQEIMRQLERMESELTESL